VVWLEEGHFADHDAVWPQDSRHLSHCDVWVPHMFQHGIRGDKGKGIVTKGKRMNIGKIRGGSLRPIHAEPAKPGPLNGVADVSARAASDFQGGGSDFAGVWNDLAQRADRRTSQCVARRRFSLCGRRPNWIDRIDDKRGVLDEAPSGTQVDL
jgi:hypothetical protein